jgi:hypothetical protein
MLSAKQVAFFNHRLFLIFLLNFFFLYNNFGGKIKDDKSTYSCITSHPRLLARLETFNQIFTLVATVPQTPCPALTYPKNNPVVGGRGTFF